MFFEQFLLRKSVIIESTKKEKKRNCSEHSFYSDFHRKNKNSDGKRARFSFRGRTLFRPFVAQVPAKWRLVKFLGRIGSFFEAAGDTWRRPRPAQRRAKDAERAEREPQGRPIVRFTHVRSMMAESGLFEVFERLGVPCEAFWTRLGTQRCPRGTQRAHKKNEERPGDGQRGETKTFCPEPGAGGSPRVSTTIHDESWDGPVVP